MRCGRARGPVAKSEAPAAWALGTGVAVHWSLVKRGILLPDQDCDRDQQAEQDHRPATHVRPEMCPWNGDDRV